MTSPLDASPPPPVPTAPVGRRLHRSRRDRMVGGVCGGIAHYLDVDPVLIRIAVVALTLSGGLGVLAYVVVVSLFASGLNWPDWVGDLSPFAWTPLVPIESWTIAAAIGLGVVALGLLAVGFGAFRRRDLIVG